MVLRLARPSLAGGAGQRPPHPPASPYAPDCNPVERLWLLLRERFLSRQVWPDDNAILQACCDAWNALAEDPDRIRTLCFQPWVRKVIS
jgi:hypothetical protein